MHQVVMLYLGVNMIEYKSKFSKRMNSFITFYIVSSVALVIPLFELERFSDDIARSGGFLILTIPLSILIINFSFYVLITLPAMLAIIFNKLNIIKVPIYLISVASILVLLYLCLFRPEDYYLLRDISHLGTLFILPMFVCISKSLADDKVKLVLYIIISIIVFILSIKAIGISYFCTTISFLCLFTNNDILARKEQYLDYDDKELTTIQIIERNIAKFLCLSNLVITILYYIKTKHILWDDMTKTYCDI